MRYGSIKFLLLVHLYIQTEKFSDEDSSEGEKSERKVCSKEICAYVRGE